MIIAYLAGAFVLGLIVGSVCTTRADYHTINRELQRKISGAEQNYFGLSQWFKAVVKTYGVDGKKLEVPDKNMSGEPTYFKIHCERTTKDDLTFTVIRLDPIDCSQSGSKWRDHYECKVPRLTTES